MPDPEEKKNGTIPLDEVVAVLSRLSTTDILARLDEIEAERKRLMPLLRIARLRERQEIDRQHAEQKRHKK